MLRYASPKTMEAGQIQIIYRIGLKYGFLSLTNVALSLTLHPIISIARRKLSLTTISKSNEH